MTAVFLCVAGVALGLYLQSWIPVVWMVVVNAMTKLDLVLIGRTLASKDDVSQRKMENRITVFGFVLASSFLALPVSLLLSFEAQRVVAAMALIAAGSTRSASMFSASRQVGVGYFSAYMLLPSGALTFDALFGTTGSGGGHIVSIIAILCSLVYVWKAWFARHVTEQALDAAYTEAEANREAAKRDAAVSRLLFQNTGLCAALFDIEGRIIAVNASWLKPLKLREEEVIGKTYAEVLPQLADHWSSALSEAFKGIASKGEGDLMPGLNGKKVYLDWSVQPWHDDAGNVGGAVTYYEDVTEKHEAIASARIKQERLELALKASKAFIWEVDRANETLVFDENAVAFYGQEPEYNMLFEGHELLVHPDDRAMSLRQLGNIDKAGGYGRMVARNMSPTGELRWVRTDVSPIEYVDGLPSKFTMLTSDITEEMAHQERLAAMMDRAQLGLNDKRKLLEELCGETSSGDLGNAAPALHKPLGATENIKTTITQLVTRFEVILAEIDSRDIALAAAVQQLRDARSSAESANIAKSQFLANMSHELRTPLNAIIGYTEILIEDAEYEQRIDAAKDANKVRNSATHLLSLINEILDLSKIEAGKMDVSREPTPLSDVLADIITSTTPLAAPNNNRLIMEIDCDRTLALTDGFRLRQCLLNLMSNACKFTENGKITLRLEVTETDENHRWYDISVTDTGIGISEEQQARLFKPFTQADGSTTRKYGGTGLGLALTREMTQLLGGEVFIESQVGKGSKFTLRIPALGLEAEDVGMTLASGSAAPLVLVVDDDPLARSLTARSAAALGMSIATAETGMAALAFCDQNTVDLVVLDLQLPDIDGNDVLAALRGSSKTRNVPVMVVSIDDDRRRSISAGAQEHLAKPCPSAVLTAAIARLVRRTNEPKTAEPSSVTDESQSRTHAPDVSEKQNKRSA